MPRVARSILVGCPYHCMNRGNGRQALFRKDGDYLDFCRLIRTGLGRYEVDLFAFCLMPNHWHLLLAASAEGATSAFFGWLGVTHVRRHHEHYRTRGGGHLYQGRFKSFPVSRNAYFRATAHYVEANARRAGLVAEAARWPWGSGAASPPLDDEGRPLVPLAPWPCRRPGDWAAELDVDAPPERLASIRTCASRGRPFGDDRWTAETAAAQGLTSSLRPTGRPRKQAIPRENQ